ncbi:sulfotransferase family protein [Amaricoccus solimangrovi]|uniref:Sulfotransferase family protein n=1 Tax=Amaricoccus solimangrovi TaxID=2589815 RepID=A0A501WMP7_9RHOB|nr:sulfotransferase family protein [Amaricoccus solimangrovi]
MSLQIVGAGFGRTGTHSLREALDTLGLGPCYHMIEIIQDPDRKVPQWVAASEGKADWDAIFEGYGSTVDWPSAAYWKEILAHYPDAKVILSTRPAEGWYDSFSETIAWLMATPATLPPHLQPWLTMASDLVTKTTFGGRPTDREHAIAVFNAYEAEVKASVPPDRLLVFQASEGWEPLCRFLDKPIPATPYPRTNTKDDFIHRFKQPA